MYLEKYIRFGQSQQPTFVGWSDRYMGNKKFGLSINRPIELRYEFLQQAVWCPSQNVQTTSYRQEIVYERQRSWNSIRSRDKSVKLFVVFYQWCLSTYVDQC